MYGQGGRSVPYHPENQWIDASEASIPRLAGFLGFNLNRDRWDPGHEVPRIDRACRF